MKMQPFLIAASDTEEYDWVLLPSSIPSSARGDVLRQLPSKVMPELALINLTFAGKTAFAAVRIDRTVNVQGNPVRDESGRLLRHTFGVLFDRPVDKREAESEVDSITPEVKEALATFLQGGRDPPRREGTPIPTPPEVPRPPRPEAKPNEVARSPFGFDKRWLAIGVGLAVLAAALWDLSLFGQVTTLKALASEAQKEKQELDMRLLNDDEMIRWLQRTPCRAQ